MNAVSRSGPSIPAPAGTRASPLLERLRRAALDRGDSQPTADTLVSWARAFILFHNKQHPSELGLGHVSHFLEHVVKTAPQPLPALAQARAALTLLYGGVLGIDLGELPQPRPPLLLDQLRLVLRVRHYSPRTEDCYVQWARRFILFHRKRHPRTGRIGRHHILEGSLQRAVVRAGVAAGLNRAIHCHTFRHSFATHLVEG